MVSKTVIIWTKNFAQYNAAFTIKHNIPFFQTGEEKEGERSRWRKRDSKKRRENKKDREQ